ncbi:hypothetical protein QBC42DRAFT_90676 [Cladorrhinum samala]|uniref:Peptidase M20 dimerisation domain-containing protein n=1 Tax=Cladorrhinum samala TaxID=585594 RepID=A0AAV9HZB1_9PEZI|nr:hypothetical protein QBC42DRAFT_90676 [Cladorrhinum samala]
MEKTDETLPVAVYTERTETEQRRRRFRPHAVVLLIVSLYLISIHASSWPSRLPSALVPNRDDFKSQCQQPDPLFPAKNEELDKAFEHISSTAFLNATVERLSGAVKVRTESFDDLGEVGEDPRWDVFPPFHDYLEKTFPLIHKKLQVEKINTHGLLYTWKGSDDSLKPTLLMAHQDVVPVPPETVGAWTYPPWSGAYDGKYIWGRGSSDCKNQLIAVMETLELLLDASFAPKRTILLSFGFDEECSGLRGAANLAKHIQQRYGKDGIAVIVDEGSGFEETWGTLFAKPGTAEKGYNDVRITVRMPGGHSSIPTDHTSIGVLSELITEIESEQYPTRLAKENPYYTQLQCGAAYSEEFPDKLKKLLAKRSSSSSVPQHTCRAKSDRLALEAAKQGRDIKYLMQTSQAVDVISGGIKVNALPERSTVVINHRINIGETTKLVEERLALVAGQVAKKYNLTLHAFDGKEEPSSIILSSSDHRLEVAPVTPASVDGPFGVLAGTVRALHGEKVIVTPGIMTGNTDTRYYWDLSKHIFRFAPGYDAEDGVGLGSIHTVDERVSVKNHVSAVQWFMMFVRNMDEADFEKKNAEVEEKVEDEDWVIM